MDEFREQSDEITLGPVEPPRVPRRRVLWGALTALAVAAGALAVTSTGGDGGPPPGLPVALGSSPESAGAMASDAMLAWVTYVPGPDLPTLGGTGPAYRLRGAVDEARVRALGAAFGLTGDVVHDGPGWTLTSPDGSLGVGDGGAAQWWYGTGGYLTVTSSSSSGSAGAVLECVPSEPATTVPGTKPGECDAIPPTPGEPCGVASDGTSKCEPPSCTVTTRACATDPAAPPTTAPPAVDLPSQDEARAKALDLLSATGLDITDAIVTVEGPFEAWYVSVETRLGGRPTGLVSSVTVGSAGEVQYANGYLAEPERMGDYPVLDTRAAIDRANAQPGIGLGRPLGGGVESQVGIASSGSATCDAAGSCQSTDLTAPAPTDTTVACGVTADGTEPCLLPPDGCSAPVPLSDVPGAQTDVPTCVAPVEPTPGPGFDGQPLEIVLVDATPSLVMLGAVDGSTDVYLVPGYRFTATDAGQVDLPAVADSVLTAPPTTDSSAITPTEPPVSTPPTDPCVIAVEQDQSSTTHTVQPPPDCVAPEPTPLADGEQPQVGVGYYVDVDVLDGHCTWVSVQVAGVWWWAAMSPGSLSAWSTPTEGGTFTLIDGGNAQFVGDAQRTKVALLTPYNGDGSTQPGCA